VELSSDKTGSPVQTFDSCGAKNGGTMKSILNWFKELRPHAMETVAPEIQIAHAVGQSAHVPVTVIPAPVPVPVNIPAFEGPEAKLVTRGSKLYGICPQCESLWNVRERLARAPRIDQLHRAQTVKCPNCNTVVGLPASLDVRKLS